MHNHCTVETAIRTTCTQKPSVRYCTIHNIKSIANHLYIESLENTGTHSDPLSGLYVQVCIHTHTHVHTNVHHYKSILFTKLLKYVSDSSVIDTSTIDDNRVSSGTPR